LLAYLPRLIEWRSVCNSLLHSAHTVRAAEQRLPTLPRLDQLSTLTGVGHPRGDVMLQIPQMLNVPNRLRQASAVALFSLTIATVPAFAAPGNGNDCVKHPDNPGCMTDPPPASATPELDSLLLFGTGLAGLGGYALTRLRARRRQDGDAAGSGPA
jgi:hypothetical protein